MTSVSYYTQVACTSDIKNAVWEEIVVLYKAPEMLNVTDMYESKNKSNS